MRIQNTSSANIPVPLTVVKSDGTHVNFSLGIGEFFYTDSDVQTKSVIIQVKKGNIQTFNENKPDSMNYFTVYQNGQQPAGSVVTNIPAFEDPLDKYRGQFNIPSRPKVSKVVVATPKQDLNESSDKVLFPEKVEQANKILEETPVPIVKNKGGRPKGSKDTVKRGEPKLKKPPGRPINTEALKGKSVDEVVAKCESRGYSIRKRQEDGVTFLGTADLRFDRVNIVIENGIVTDANIG